MSILYDREHINRLSNQFLSNGSSCCSTCNGYYGPNFEEPVCATCHAFLYATDVDAEIHLQMFTEEIEALSEEADSGNDEPPDYLVIEQQNNNRSNRRRRPSSAPSSGGQDPRAPNNESEDHENLSENELERRNDQSLEKRRMTVFLLQALETHKSVFNDEDYNNLITIAKESPSVFYIGLRSGNCSLFSYVGRENSSSTECTSSSGRIAHVRVESLAERLSLLTLPRCNTGGDVGDDIVESLPSEVLVLIFSYLDDISLFAIGHVCKRWQFIVRSQTNSEQWQTFTRRRWPLYKPLVVVSDWFNVYSCLVQSSFCLTCIYQMADVIPTGIDTSRLREKRLAHDHNLMVQDPPEGICALPLDTQYYHWQAYITGPVGSPYEGGIFFLYLKIPFSYPWVPPVVRFLTKIFHPNISKHGDVGTDSIQQHNWSPGVTIPKVLISIQSLLTDPYYDVCMEPQIGKLYCKNRSLFDAIARRWTWKFAMHDVFPPVSSSCQVQNNVFSEFTASNN